MSLEDRLDRGCLGESGIDALYVHLELNLVMSLQRSFGLSLVLGGSRFSEGFQRAQEMCAECQLCPQRVGLMCLEMNFGR